MGEFYDKSQNHIQNHKIQPILLTFTVLDNVALFECKLSLILELLILSVDSNKNKQLNN